MIAVQALPANLVEVELALNEITPEGARTLAVALSRLNRHNPTCSVTHFPRGLPLQFPKAGMSLQLVSIPWSRDQLAVTKSLQELNSCQFAQLSEPEILLHEQAAEA